MTTFKLSWIAMPLAFRKRLSGSALGTFWRQLAEFRQVYSLYRRAAHSRLYCARIAWGIAFRFLPF